MKLKLRLIFWRLWPNVKAAGRGIPERRLVFCSLETAALAFNSADTFSLVMNIKERTVFAATMPQENGSHCKSILSQHEGCSSWVRRVIVRSFSESSYSSEVLKTSEKNVFFSDEESAEYWAFPRRRLRICSTMRRNPFSQQEHQQRWAWKADPDRPRINQAGLPSESDLRRSSAPQNCTLSKPRRTFALMVQALA